MSIDNVQDITPRVQYVAAAAQTAFDYPFPIFEDGDLVVMVNDVQQVLTTHYTVTGETADAGGTVTFVTARTAGQVITIYRDIPIERTSDFQPNGPYDSDAMNDELDRMTMVDQQLENRINRSLRIPISAAVDDNEIELNPASFANMYLSFDADGKPSPTTLSPTALTQSAFNIFYLLTADRVRTAAEITAGVTPTNYYYPFGNVRRYGATGDGVTDDTVAIQNAVNAVLQERNGVLYFPPNNPGAAYKTTARVVVNKAITIRGAGPEAVTLYGVGVAAGQHLLDLDCLAADVVEHAEVSGITIRSDTGLPNAMRLKNASYVLIKNVRFYGVSNGVVLEGTRCYSNFFEQITGYSITNSTVRFAAGFTGGGHFVFDGCTFTGATGFSVPTTAGLDNLVFNGCNWEQCTTVGLFIGGLAAGVSVVGCRWEGGDSTDINLRPFGAAEYVSGVVISGCVFSASDSGAISRINIGGDSGIVRGFAITGNTVTHGTDTYAANFVTLNGDGESGVISGNLIRGTTASGAGVVGTIRAGVVVHGNENLSGKLAEHWGFQATAPNLSTTPSVATLGQRGRLVLSNTGATSITDFIGFSAKQEIELYSNTANTTLVHNALLNLKGAVNQAMANSNIIVLTRDPTNVGWVEKSRNF